MAGPIGTSVLATQNFRTFPEPGNIIDPMIEKNRLPVDQADKNTLETAKKVAQMLHAELGWTPPPYMMQAIAETLSGGMTTRVTKFAEKAATGTLEAADMPMIGWSWGKQGYSQPVDDFYERQAYLRQASGSKALAPGEDMEYAMMESVSSQVETFKELQKLGVLTDEDARRMSNEVIETYMENK